MSNPSYCYLLHALLRVSAVSDAALKDLRLRFVPGTSSV
jgi:hypothetical protein